MARRISSQKEFAAIKSKFNSGSDYREFKKRYFFHPDSQIEKTGIPRNQVLRKQSGARWEIFGKMREKTGGKHEVYLLKGLYIIIGWAIKSLKKSYSF